MIGSLIGGGLKVGAAVWNGIQSARANRKMQQQLADRQKENEAWYNMRYNEDATQRADAQRILSMTQDAIRNRNRQAAATQAVMGGTEESVAAARKANADAMAEAAGNIALAGDKRKDAIESQYQATRNSLYDKQLEQQQQHLKNIQQQAVDAANAGASIATALDGGSLDSIKKM